MIEQLEELQDNFKDDSEHLDDSRKSAPGFVDIGWRGQIERCSTV